MDPKTLQSSPVTLKDIAQAIGISHAAVSLALRNSSRISASTCEKVQMAARSMGYQPNPLATGLAHFKRSSKTLPVRAALAWINLWPKPGKLRGFKEFDGYWRGAAAAAEKFGYRLEEFVCNEQVPVSRLKSILLARGISGILLPPHQIAPEWGDFPWERFSVVRFGRSLQNPRVNVVTADQTGNALMAMDAIRERGYRRIAMVTTKALGDRRGLFTAGFLMAQLELPRKHRLPVFNLNEHPGSAFDDFALWLKREKPDAILTDYAEMPGLLRKWGYRIPEEIGLATTSVLDCRIDAGIDQNPEEIGRVAVLALLSLIYDNTCGIPSVFRQILIEGKWANGDCLPYRK